MSQVYHLFVRSFSTDRNFRHFVQAADAAAKEDDCTPYLAARLHECQLLEPGSETGHLWAASCPTKDVLDTLWSRLARTGTITSLDEGHAPQCLSIPNLPDEGLPDPSIPTAANIVPPARTGPVGYMIIEGSVSDQARIDTYRDVILPLIGERGGYYTVFAFADQVEVLSGSWNHQVFIISRWPDLVAAHDFWLSDRYQTVAIPRRLGAGEFDVVLAQASD